MSDHKETIGTDPVEFWDAIVEIVEEYRELRGLSRKELGEAAATTRQGYSDFVSLGKRRRRLSLYQFALMAKELRIPKSTLGLALLKASEGEAVSN